MATPFGTHIDNPVGFCDHIQVVFNDNNGVAGIDKSMQNFYQFIDISHVETDGRLIKNVNRLRQLTAAFADVVLYLRELSDELDALGFAAGECRRRLAQGQVTETDVLHQFQRVKNRRDRREELNGFIDFHLENFTDAFAFPLHFQGLVVKAHRIAYVAVNLHIRQEAHFQGFNALAFTSFTAAALHIEGEAGGGVAASLCFFGLSKEFTDIVPETDVCGRARTRCLADRSLVYFKDAVNRFPAGDTFAAFRSRDGFSFLSNQGDHVL